LPASVAGVPVTAIGTITEGNSLVCYDDNGVVEIDDSGYRHF
jgi:thiamine monophosphate kinase